MTTFKPGDKVLIHMRDEGSKLPINGCWGITAMYECYLHGEQYPHRVIFDDNEQHYCDEEIQLLEDE